MPRKNLEIKKKRQHMIGHGHIKGVTRGAADPRPGGDERQAIKHYEEIKKKIAKDIMSVPVWKVKLAGEAAADAEDKLKKAKEAKVKAQRAKDEATVKAQMAKDEAEEKARQKKNAEEAKKKPKKKQGRKGLSIKRRGK